jgi:ribonuclease VapC
MIVVDTSALIAIYRNEPERSVFDTRIATAFRPVLAASTYLETVAVISREARSRTWLDLTITAYGMRIAAIDEAVARLAADAFERYGRGRSHPARLNFGDCLVYAVSKVLDLPLLFKGGDFARTDITPAL